MPEEKVRRPKVAVGATPRWKMHGGERSGRAVALACAAGAVLVLGVPYALPVPRALSVSYCMGFSNRGCVALLLLFLAGFAWWYGPVPTEEPPVPATTGTVARPGRGALGLALAITLVTQAGVWSYIATFGPAQEALYLLDRTRHLRAGERVYRDFELIYGPALVYLPLWCSRLFGGSVSHGNELALLHGYGLALLLESVAGVVLLWLAVRVVGRGTPRAPAIFFLLFASVWAWSWLFAEQYTPLRFWLTTAIALLAFHMGVERARPWSAVAVLLGGVGLLLLLSPEQAFVLMGGTVVLVVGFVPLRTDWGRRLWWGMGVMLAGGGVLLAVAERTEIFRTFHAMASGSYAMPVTPSGHAVVVVGLLMAGATMVVEAVRRRSGPTPELYLMGLSLFLLPAAFGRFDLVHAVGNMMPALLVGWCVVARRAVLWRWAVRGYVVAVFLSPLPFFGYQVYLLSKHAMEVHRGEVFPMALADTRALPRVYSPFAPVEETRGKPPTFVAEDGRFYGLEDVIDAQQVQQKVQEMEALPPGGLMLVLPHGCVQAPTRIGTMLFTMGFYARKAFRETRELEPVCAAYAQDYEELPVSSPGGVVAVPTPAPEMRFARHR